MLQTSDFGHRPTHVRTSIRSCVVLMACAPVWRQTSPLSCSLLPLLFRPARLASITRTQSPFSSSSFPARISSTKRTPLMEVSVHARRLAFKEDEVTSAFDLCFEAPLKIVEYPDPILRARNKRIDAFDENLKKLVSEMFDVMYKTDGIGLSAPQVGINVQLLVFNPAGERGVGEELVLINPKAYRFSRKVVPFNEGCLSFPGIYADVERPASLKVDAQDITGAKFTIDMSGLPARVFQHEFDHLQGILFFDRMTEEVLDSILPELQALEDKYEQKTGLPSPEKIEKRKGKRKAAGFGRS